MKYLLSSLSCLLLLLLCGCASYPMGLTRAEWEALPPERQAELRAEQYRIDAAERARNEAAARERASAAAADERQYSARLAERRADARYGDLVVVTLQGGTIEWRDRRYPLQPVAFELVRGERRSIELIGYRTDGDATLTATERWVVSFSEDGNTVVLNDSPFGTPIPLVNSGAWDRGETVSLAARAGGKMDDLNLSGMTATVRYKEAPGKPQRVIIERY